MEDYEKVNKEVKRTLLRFETINNDYIRDNTGISTVLVGDTCDLLYYIHTDPELKWEDISTKQRITRNYFENEYYQIAIFPPHAFEFLRFVFNVLETVFSISRERKNIRSFMKSRPFINRFLKYYKEGNFEEATKLWKSDIWNDIVSFSMNEGKEAKRLLSEPLDRFIAICERGRIKPISDILDIKVDSSFVDEETYRKVLSELNRDFKRSGFDVNNEIDALAAGMTKGVNFVQNEFYFSLSTLATSPLSAYSRSTSHDKTNFCRNTSVSSYKLNIERLQNTPLLRKEYVEKSIRLMQSLLERYDSLELMGSLGDDAFSDEFSLSGLASAKIISSLGLFGEYYFDVYEKVVSPMKSDADSKSDHVLYNALEVLGCSNELLSDEGAIIEGFREAIKIVIEHAQHFAEHMKKFVSSQEGIKIAGVEIENQVANIMKRIEDIGKESRKRVPK